ncbi:ABC transporter substrate-binding protein [Actinocrispum sp. NPDC049592]|uniref:peptide ABC transporter substrate-binding protein n=1 Tax=Actinocrispum sp. NPDC049592 TaxID=3154835 RepID=UPI00343C5CEC
MRTRKAALVAMPLALSVALTGCGGGNKDTGSGPTTSGNSDATVSIYGTQPQTNMLPANATDAGAAKFIEGLYSGLVGLRPEDGKPYNLVAESITTSDSKTFDIKIKKGWKFHDGTEVKAKNFVDAWNFAAYGPNAQLASDFFAQIEGFDQVFTEDPDGPDGPQKPATPAQKTMSGLKIVNDYEFTATLSAPSSVWDQKIGYRVFAPLPDKFFTMTPDEFAKNPIGNGPLKFVSFTPNSEIRMTRNDDYPDASKKVKFKTLVIKIYSSQEAAYKDLLSDKLDFMEALPPSAKAGGKYKTDLKDQVLQANLLGIAALSVPDYLPEYKSPDLRHALSLAINREQITKTVLNDTFIPADGWVPPGVDGYEPNVCADFCKYDPVRAKQLLAKSGFTGKVTIASNADGGRKEPLEAACNSIKNALGIECTFVPATDFGQFRQIIVGRKLTGLGRSDWGADYASIENFLNPIFRTGASSNDSKWSNPEVDALLKKGDSTADKAEALKFYQQAHHLLVNEMPKIPTWVEKGVGARSKNLKSAQLNFRRQLEYASVEPK